MSKEGLDTERAVIKTKRTRDDAARFCVEYVGNASQQCINEELKTRLNDRVTANCKTGEFADFHGSRYRFEGANKNGDLAKFLVRDLSTGQIADGSSASGYPTNMQIFKALCPKTAPAEEDW